MWKARRGVVIRWVEKFRVNLTWAQRFLQIAVAVPAGDGSARAIPVGIRHCPSAKKPGRRATAEEWAAYRHAQQALCLPAVAVGCLKALRTALDDDPNSAQRQLLIAVDGGYTNTTLFRQLPERSTLVGRLRKDAVLYSPPIPTAGRGRRRCYGNRLPTPAAIRQHNDIPWQTIRAYAAGKTHDFDVKVVDSVRWRGAGSLNLRLLIIRPLAYRPTKSHRLLYRQPAYLICSDPTLPAEQILQAYRWRWEVEMTFHDEKTLLGMGEAQVRTAPAIAAVPTFIAGLYAYLHLAALQVTGEMPALPRPKWQSPTPTDRMTTAQLQGRIRADLWGSALGVNITDFVQQAARDMKPEIFPKNPFSAVVFALK